jgi:nucleotide-binding universal stress UspA family protein
MFDKILLPIDLEQTELSERAIEIAKEYVERYGAKIIALSVLPNFNMPVVASYFPEGMIKKAHEDVCRELERFIEARFDHGAAVHCSVDGGSPHKAIVNYARDNAVDLIIMPSRGGDISKVLLGSCTAHVVQRAPCSVLVVRP